MTVNISPRPTVLALAVVLLLGAAPALAVWNESIEIVGEAVPAGTTVTLTMATGEIVDGEVSEDGRRIVFVLPGNGPGSGTLTFTSPAGVAARYPLPAHDGTRGLTLDLNDSRVRAGGPEKVALVDDMLKRWTLSFGVGYAYWASDYFQAIIDRNEQQLIGILQDLGGTGITTDSQADDGADGYVLALGIRRNLDSSSSLYGEVGYSESDAFKGRITGGADVFGNTFATTAAGKSELEIVTAMLGYERQIGSASNWRWYAQVGAMWTDLNDQSTTVAFVNGTQVDAFDSESSDDDTAALLGVGIRYRVPLDAVDIVVDLGVQQSNEVFNGERLTRFGLNVGAAL